MNTTRAVQAARRLHRVATVLIVVVSVASVIAVLLGVVVIAVANTTSARWAGVATIGGGIFAWLTALLPMMIAQTFSRYVQARLEPTS